MPINDAAFTQLMNLEPACRKLMDELAQDAAKLIRDNHSWHDDTGSLADSTIGFEVKVGDPYANWLGNDENRWTLTQQGKIVSAYPRNWPPTDNYDPHIETRDVDEANPALIVTSWVDYALETFTEEGILEAYGNALDYLASMVEARLTIELQEILGG